MLKTKLAYMALGAVIASFGYFIGTLNNLNAEDEVARVKKLIVSEKIIVGSEESFPQTHIDPGTLHLTGISPDNNRTMLQAISPGNIKCMDITDTDELTGFSMPYYLLNLNDQTPSIEMHKPTGKKITLSIDKQAVIKLSNGGLKSKTVAVD